jgi:hypothetical protein
MGVSEESKSRTSKLLYLEKSARYEEAAHATTQISKRYRLLQTNEPSRRLTIAFNILRALLGKTEPVIVN